MYEYATGLIRVLEKYLPDKTDIERMVLAKSSQEAFNVLADTTYSDNITDRKIEDYNKIAEDDINQIKNLFSKILDDNTILDFLFIEFDFLNIKIILKSYLFKKDIINLSSHSIIKGKILKNIIKYKLIKLKLLETEEENEKSNKINSLLNQDGKNINKIILQSINNILTKLKKKKKITPSIVDTETDIEMINSKQKMAKKIHDSFINDLIKLETDFLNTKILLRYIAQKTKTQKKKKPPFVKGGRIKIEELKNMLSQDEVGLFNNLKEIFEWYKISNVVKEYTKNKNLSEMENSLDRAKNNFIKTAAKQSSSGIPVVLGYFIERLTSAVNIRIIMSAKINKIPADQIKKRIII